MKSLSSMCKSSLPKAYRYDEEHPCDGLNAIPTAPTVKHEASELPVDDERCSNCGLHCKVNACIYEPSPPIAVQGSEDAK
jgi:NAD-dependent dihydropyrimidine dehydrogenase PreA subunit